MAMPSLEALIVLAKPANVKAAAPLISERRLGCIKSDPTYEKKPHF
jgi:hypothetical protein